MQMVAPWEEQTGAKVKYTGTRDINTVLTTGVASGVLPDLAGLPGPGQMADTWADSLVDLWTTSSTSRPTRARRRRPWSPGPGQRQAGRRLHQGRRQGPDLVQPQDPADYGTAPPATWDELQTYITANKAKAQAPWCLGIESGAASGWPGTDWIEDLVLRQAGPDVYTQWYQGKVKWTDPAIKTALDDLR